MPTPEATLVPAQAGPAEDRRALVEAARAVFARDGWTHSTLEAVAETAGLETELVGHYFKDKDQLLLSVLLDSAASLSAALTVIAESHLAEITDLERDLVALGRAWLTPLATFPEHFAIVRHLQAESARLPAGLLEMWQTAGPRQAQRELARRLQRVADRGLLDIADADRAAGRFIQLVAGGVVARSFHGAVPLAEYETEQLISTGVADFIRLYRPDAGR
ncbi:TetR/AcrR family transcriptional regulator C-terminal domain-containing protein [Streptomyces cylindrosporus]|uniref:TetR/AcrR family transcriptional regulator C-terminal domain-containing protein n=1 Tax=Streptomyces cylindrosporus TaxID=2927583 RepID=A0ABS9YQ97_9ACTN|nr:TetR/AcrR family transcriptional regulator C-terminal domain-containing protein [Streptomyces cylindrosporus]MCI3279339.1 TetR/AcrR family transcriptional regulator C-terminal domain-containing protein [Streptomyces cylindrosporus]